MRPRWIRLMALALALCCTAATCVKTTEWSMIDLHPLRDTTALSLSISHADGSTLAASIGHQVRPEGESAVQGTVRTGIHYGSILIALIGGITGNPFALIGGVAGAEVTK